MYILYKSRFFQQFGFHFSDLNVWLFNNPAAEEQVSPTYPLLIRFRERSSSLKVSSLERSLLRSQTWFQTFSWSPEYKCAWKWNNWEDRTNLLQTENLRHQISWCLTEPQSYWQCEVNWMLRRQQHKSRILEKLLDGSLRKLHFKRLRRMGWALWAELSKNINDHLFWPHKCVVTSSQVSSTNHCLSFVCAAWKGADCQVWSRPQVWRREARQIWSLDKAKLQHSSEGVKFTR